MGINLGWKHILVFSVLQEVKQEGKFKIIGYIVNLKGYTASRNGVCVCEKGWAGAVTQWLRTLAVHMRPRVQIPALTSDDS